MKENNDVKIAVYNGMSIFEILKDNEIKLNNINLTLEDKKYLSLYLGIVNSNIENNNELNLKKYDYGMKVNYNHLSLEKYLQIYNKYFIDIFNNIDFDSIENYLIYLLNQDIIIKLNKKFKYIVKINNDNSNKKLVKQIS